MKKVFITAWLVVIVIAIATIFWYNDYKYSLPTPVPASYVDVKTGEFVNINTPLKYKNNKPLFLHFFNPDCPCSRFNIKHFKTLVQQYGDRANFAVVLMNTNAYTSEQVQKKFDLTVPVIADPSIATACGVYSTPQAAILTAQNQLYYRGNYNSSRYCTNAKTEFARMALVSLLKNNHITQFNALALTAYGCSLPECNR